MRKLGYLATHEVREDWLDWADAQSDLKLRWAHMPFCRFCLALAHIKRWLFSLYLYLIDSYYKPMQEELKELKFKPVLSVTGQTCKSQQMFR